jgi:subtilisin family serine protease
VQAPIARKKHGGGSNVKRASPAGHAAQLTADADEVSRVQRRVRRPAGVTPTLIFKLRLHPSADLDEDMLGRFGLTLIARDEDKTLVVFASDEDLKVFRDRVNTYGSLDGPKYGEIGNIEGLDPITAQDRTGRRLATQPILPDDVEVPVDVELWHPGTAAGAQERLDELRTVVTDGGGRLTDHYIGADLAVARCRIDALLAEVILELDIVRELDRIPATAIGRLQALGLGASDLPEILEAPDNATGVLMLDSGVTANHPLLAPAMGDAQVFPDALGQRDGLGASDGDQRLHGHGTAVAGFVVWGRPHEAVTQNPLQAEVVLFSARVLDERGEYDPDLLVEHQLEEAIRYFLDAYPRCRVINLSLGDDRLIFAPGNRQTRLAARIDELAYQLQARRVLFVISSGNYTHDPVDHASHVHDYPRYLLGPRAALIEPATAALALTVGGLSAGGHPARLAQSAGRRAIGGTEGHPSPFTRAGPGVGRMIKPDFTEVAGDYAYDPAAPTKIDSNDPGLGLPTTNRDFGPPSGQLLRAVAGTSFAAPAVAHAAALVFNRYPAATPNLVRALLADSALLPKGRPPPLDATHDDDSVLRIYGYGTPSADRAGASDNNDVLLVAESTIAPDAYQLFELPFLPEDFLDRPGARCISVSLAFDPPTRQTRGDSYLGVTMQFHVFRNIALDSVGAAFRDWKAAPAGSTEQQLESSLSKVLSKQRVKFSPGVTQLSKGTLQRGLHHVRNANWDYDGGPLILATSCLRKWAPPELSAQRYAIVVSLKHSDPEANLHAPLRARLQPRLRARLQ